MKQEEINKFCEELESKGIKIEHADLYGVHVDILNHKVYVRYETDLMVDLFDLVVREAYREGVAHGEAAKAQEIRSALFIGEDLD